MLQRIIIIGAGGFGREMLRFIKTLNAIKPTWEVAGFIDDNKTPGEVINGIKVLGGTGYLAGVTEKTAAVIAIALPGIRKKIKQTILNPNIYFPALMHPSAIIDDRDCITIGEGSILCAGTILTTNITIGKFVLVNLCTTINHDAVINDFSTVMPGVNISTGAQVGEGCYIGTGSKISKPEKIASWQTLSAGTIIA